MGEVWKAEDVALRRTVAIKILPAANAQDRESNERFKREARTAAQLNHPKIAILYNFEETATERFLVMEYVPGDTLRERIGKQKSGVRSQESEGSKNGKPGGIPLEEALAIAKQIAEALEHAHEKGIIQRDLKPANVKATRWCGI